MVIKILLPFNSVTQFLMQKNLTLREVSKCLEHCLPISCFHSLKNNTEYLSKLFHALSLIRISVYKPGF